MLVQSLGWEEVPKWGHGNPLQYSCLDSLDRGTWWTAVHGVTKSRTWLSSACMHEYILTNSSIVSYYPSLFPDEDGGVSSPGVLRWLTGRGILSYLPASTSLSLFFTSWSKKEQPVKLKLLSLSSPRLCLVMESGNLMGLTGRADPHL